MPGSEKRCLSRLLTAARGGRSFAAFARDLGLSYTFVREMEAGNRFPSERKIPALAAKLGVDPGFLALCVHCDRSKHLCDYLGKAGLLPSGAAFRRELAIAPGPDDGGPDAPRDGVPVDGRPSPPPRTPASGGG